MRIASHRGIGTPWPENTLEAFSAAVASGATILEMDLRTTLDGEVLLIHNKSHPHIKEKLIINETDCKRLLVAAASANVTLNRFADAFREFSAYEFILDIKWRSGEETLKGLFDWATATGQLEEFQRRTNLLLWLPDHVVIARRLFPQARIVANRTQCLLLSIKALIVGKAAAAHDFKIVSIPAIIFRIPILARRIVRSLRAEGVRLLIYLPTTSAEMKTAKKLGVDIVMADFSDLWRCASSTDPDVQ